MDKEQISRIEAHLHQLRKDLTALIEIREAIKSIAKIYAPEMTIEIFVINGVCKYTIHANKDAIFSVERAIRNLQPNASFKMKAFFSPSITVDTSTLLRVIKAYKEEQFKEKVRREGCDER
jgi:hypothetical protein